MPTPAETVEAFQRRNTAEAAAAAAAAAARWDLIDTGNIIGSWSELAADTAAVTTGRQRRAAEAGAAYTPAVLRAQGATSQLDGRVRTTALAGTASDGRPLETLITLPAVQAVRQMADGMALDDAVSQGRGRVMMFTATQVLDAGRLAASVGMVADRAAGGWRRQLRGATSCARCVVLAGAFYRWNEGFQRHPRCDCVHVPAVGPQTDLEGLEGFDPQAHFDSLTAAEQDRVFTKAGAQAIRDGADLGQVVNARRGMRTTTAYGKQVRTTTVGTGRRQTSFTRAMRADGGPQTGIRLMPEQIYADAAGDRDEAIRLLRRFGYLR